MKEMLRKLSWVLGLGLMVGAIGCAGTPNKQSTGEYLDSTAISAKIKAALVDDPEVKGMDVKVTTFKDVVQLSGFVDNPAQKKKAEDIAWGVDGVKSVENKLTVKSAVSQ